MDFRSRYRYNTREDLIGKGGFAKVYKAFDSKLEMEVALKLYASEVSEKYDLISEIKKVVRLEHSNICRYFDYAVLSSTSGFGEEEELQVGVMEYLDGGDIRSYVKQHPQHLEKLFVDVLQGLSYLHQHRIIHRDLKPANILIRNTATGPVAKITDFGISKNMGSSSTKSSELLGTIEYMAPEQFNPSKYGIGGSISYNLDLWSFGCLVYELVRGESFFGGREALGTEQVMRKILEDVDQTKIEALPQPFKAVVEQCLVKHARERVQMADELISILQGRGSARQAGNTEVEASRINSREKPIVADEATQVIEKEELPLPIPGAGAGIGGREIAVAAEQKGAVVQNLEKKNKQQLLFGGITAIVLLLVGVYVFGSGKAAEASLAEATVVGTDTLALGKEDLPEAIASDIKANYDYAYPFSEGLALVVLNGKYGFIDKSGREVIALKYDDAFSFSEGLALVVLNGKYRFIDKSGREVIALKYDNADPFSEGLALVQWNDKWGFIDKSGREVIALNYDHADSFSEGLALVRWNDKWGFIDKSGREVIALKYDYAYPFSEGLALVRWNDKWGYIDKIGREVIALKYDHAYPFSEGLASVELNDKWGFIDKSGREVIALKCDHAYPFSEGLALVVLNHKWGFIDKSGREVIALNYDYAYRFSEGLAYVRLNGKEFYIDKRGNCVRDCD